MQGAVEKIRAARQAIWLDQPVDIGRLKARRKGPRNQGASPLIYADMKLWELVVFLNHMRAVARECRVDLETMKVVAEGLLESFAKQYGNWFEITDTAAVIRGAKGALHDVQTLEEYAVVVEELALYVGRVEYWIDLLIPWAKFGEAFEQTKG